MTSPSFRGSLARTVVLQGFAYLLAIAVNTTIGRALGRDGLGLYALANSFLLLSSLVLGGGLQFANPYYLGQDPARIDGVLAVTQRWITAIAALTVTMLLTRVYVRPMEALLGVEPRYSWLILAALPAFLAHQNVQAIFLGVRRFIAFNLIPLALTACTFGGLLILVVLARHGIPGFLVAWLVAQAAVATVSGARVLRLRNYAAATPVRLRELLSVGGRAVVANLLSMLVWRVDVFLLHGIAGRSAVGLYAAAVSISEMTLKIPLQAGTVLFPFVASDSSAAAQLLTARTCRLTIAGVTGLCALLVVLGKPVLHILYGSGYVAGYATLLALLPGMVAWAAAVILSNYFAGRGYPAITFVAPIAALLADVVLNLALAPRLATLGTALSSSASYLLWLLLLLLAFDRTRNVTLRDVLLVDSRDWREVKRLLRGNRRRLATDG